MKDPRIDKILKAIQDIASGNFLTHIEISDAMDEIDGIATGINMLSGEIQVRIEKQAKENEKLIRTVKQLKELKLALSKSEELFQQIFQTSPDAISISRLATGVLVEVNRSLEKLTGYSRKELIGHSAFELGLWADKAVREEMTKHLKKKGEFANIETDFRVKGDNIVQGLLSASILNINDEPHLVAIGRDITEIRAVERVQHIIYNISNAVNITQNLNDLFVTIQNELGKIFDTRNFFIAFYNKEDDTFSMPFFVDEKDAFNGFPAKKTLTGYMIRNDRPILMKNRDINKLVKSGEIEDVGTPSKIWLGVPLKHRNEIIGALVVQNYEDEQAYTEKDLEILTFVSAQISLSIATKQAYDDVQVEKAYFEQLFEGSPETVVVTTNDGKLLRVNSEFERLFGYSQEEAIGKYIDKLIAPDELNSEARQISQKVARGEKILIETIRKHKDGRNIHVSVLGTPIETEGGQVAVYGIYRDITERKTHEIALKAAKEKAEESDRLKSAFLANMSHEIRTPMNAILGFSELLKTENLTREARHEYIQIISSKGNELMLIINDIIDISKIEAGDIQIIKSDLPVIEFLQQLYKEFSKEKSLMNKDHQTQFRLKIPENDNPVIHTDSSRLKQILYNLISNALKFTNEGFVEIGYYIQDQKVVFFVRDTGIGITEDKKEIIFDRFRQVDESINSEFGGTGLGLAISRQLTTLLGGKIWMESEENQGSTFYLYLPLLKNPGSGSGSAPAASTANQKKDNELIDLSGKKILIAEDDSASYLYIESFLKRTNSEIIWARDGGQLLEILKADPSIDLILMDLRMPVLNGIDATRIIRKTYPDLPVIAITAYAFSDDREKSIQAGCNDYLSKPVKIKELSETLKKYLK